MLTLPASEAITWEPLKEGNKIHLFASGFTVTKEALKRAKDIIKKAGYEPVIPEDLLNPDQFNYANTEEYRGNHLRRLLTDPNARFLWAVRGGRGTSSTLPFIDDLNRSHPPKIIVGFSDITALHLWAFRRNYPSLHGVTLTYNYEFSTSINGKTSLTSILDILSGKVTELKYNLTPFNITSQQLSIPIKSKIIGGNASLIQRNIGTSTALDPKGSILFLEEIGEVPTRLLETLIHFKRSKLFAGVKAIILGDLTAGMKEEEIALANGFAHLCYDDGSRNHSCFYF